MTVEEYIKKMIVKLEEKYIKEYDISVGQIEFLVRMVLGFVVLNYDNEFKDRFEKIFSETFGTYIDLLYEIELQRMKD